MLSDEPGTNFGKNSGVVGKRAWMFALNAVRFQGLPCRMFGAQNLEDRSTVCEIGRCEHAAFMLIRKTANSITILPRDMKSLNILRSEGCFFLEFILIWVALASQNSSEKLRLCARWSVFLFDPSSVFFVRLRVRCGSIIQRVRDISDLSVFTRQSGREHCEGLLRIVRLSCSY